MYPSRANSGVNLKYYRREVTQNIWDEIYRARNLTNNPREISFWCSKSFGGQQAFVTHHIAAVFPMKNSPQLPVVSHDDERIPVWRLSPAFRTFLTCRLLWCACHFCVNYRFTPSSKRQSMRLCSLFTGVDNVARGRGRRCTWPWATLHVAVDNE